MPRLNFLLFLSYTPPPTGGGVKKKKTTKIRVKENILQNLCNNIMEIFDSKFTIFKSKCEELIQTLSVRYNKQIDHLQNELKTKDKIIDQLLKSLAQLILN